jgi:ribosome biogenesis GTPase A
MPPKKKNQKDEDLGLMKAARFGRVKNTLTMGFGESVYASFGFLVFRTSQKFLHLRRIITTVGLPNVGKSSLTNLLAGAAIAEAANYVRKHTVQ